MGDVGNEFPAHRLQLPHPRDIVKDNEETVGAFCFRRLKRSCRHHKMTAFAASRNEDRAFSPLDLATCDSLPGHPLKFMTEKDFLNQQPSRLGLKIKHGRSCFIDQPDP